MTNHDGNTVEEWTSKDVSAIFFMTKPSLPVHVYCLTQQPDLYLHELTKLGESGLASSTLSTPTKARVMAALQITNQNTTIIESFWKWANVSVVDLVKACQILDRPRLMRQLETRIASIEAAHPHVVSDQEDLCQDNDAEHATGNRRIHKQQSKHNRSHPIDKSERPHKRTRTRQVDAYRKELDNQRQLLVQDDHPQNIHNNKILYKAAHASSAVRELIGSASLTGALSKKIRRWARSTLTKDFLEFILLTGSFDVWKQLADYVHFRPNDFALDYFLKAVHGGELPEGSFVRGASALMATTSPEAMEEAFSKLAASHGPQLFRSYNFLRTQPRLLRNTTIAKKLAEKIPLSTAVWYMEELAQCSKKQVPSIVARRLREENWMEELAAAGDNKVQSFGKIVERVLTFQSAGWHEAANELLPAAETSLGALKEKWATGSFGMGFTLCIGDMSYSMTAAIQAATILSAMVSSCFEGELCFFDHVYHKSPIPKPSSAEDVLTICRKIRATGGTSLAAGLWPYFENKVKIDRIVMVTDEEENTPCQGFMFAPLLKKYKEEVYADVQLIVICVGKGDSSFRKSLERNWIEYKLMEIDEHRPDLSKFDSMLGQIAILASQMTLCKQKLSSDQQEGIAKNEEQPNNDFVLV